MDIPGKVAVVTGGGGEGIGRSVSLRLALEGAAVVVADIDDVRGHEVVLQIRREGGQATFVHADVASEEMVRKLFATTQKAFGGVDIVVNNAGPYHPGLLERWPETIATNLIGTMTCTLQAIQSMRRRHGGAIVNFGSTSSLGFGRRSSGSPAYDAAKAGIMHLTASLAPLLEETIRVNCIVPDWVGTPTVRAFWEKMTPAQRKQQGVPGRLIEVAALTDEVMRLITDDTLAGRVLVWWSEEEPSFVSDEDLGYRALRPVRAPVPRASARKRRSAA